MFLKNLIRIRKPVLFFIALFVFLMPKLNAENHYLPKPGGKYKVGTTNFYFTDSTRYEKDGKLKRNFRRLYVKAWYPAVNETEGFKPQKHLRNIDKEFLLDTYKTIGLTSELLDSIQNSNTYSYPELPVNSSQNKFPVIVFSSGYYFGIADVYTHLMEQLASNGYIVLSLMHPYEQPIVVMEDGEELKLRKKYAQLSFLQLVITEKTEFRKPDTEEKANKVLLRYLRRLKRFDRALDIWTKDTRFCVDYFKQLANTSQAPSLVKKMDFENMGIFGHSFGGAVAGQCCLESNTFKAGANLDCFQFGDLYQKNLDKPFLLIEAEQYPIWSRGNKMIYGKSIAPFYSLTLKGAKHFILCDAVQFPISKELQLKYFGNCNLQAASKNVDKYLLTFFDYYLKNIYSPLLNNVVDNLNIKFKPNNNLLTSDDSNN